MGLWAVYSTFGVSTVEERWDQKAGVRNLSTRLEILTSLMRMKSRALRKARRLRIRVARLRGGFDVFCCI